LQADNYLKLIGVKPEKVPLGFANTDLIGAKDSRYWL